ncbi:MAG: hypothetical protein ACR2FV_13255 [Ornithinimicrobium sp.]|uniref:hypothetical protein n=1 Tax=Ornithinimicrobium sp. TaxID=1977084 RepID=UPI003D9AD967
MPELPASVRVAVWASAAFAGQLPVGQVAARALPDLDHVVGLEATLTLWRDLGEQVVLVALPRPGDVAGMPRCGPELLDAATTAQELVFVPGVGAAMVPTIEPYGPQDDQGWQAGWTAYDAEPTPVHRVQAVDISQVELSLRQDLTAITAELAAVPGAPVGAGLAETLARDRLDTQWGMPAAVPARGMRVIKLAGSVLTLAEAGRDTAVQTVDSSSTLQRERIMARLADRAARALADATNVAVLHLAGWR